MRYFLALLGVLVTTNSVAGQDDTYINHISPRIGSLNGGTKIQIFGSGFDTELSFAGDAPKKEAFFVSSYGQHECKIHQDESDEKQTVCYSEPMPHGTYYIRMRINGIWLEDSHYCYNRHTGSACRFYTRDYRTPRLTQLDWVNNEPLQLVNVRGRIYTNLINSSVAEATNGRTVTIPRVWLTSGICDLQETPDEVYLIELDGPDGESDWGEFVCKVTSSFVGNQNISFIVDGSFGRSRIYTSQLHVSADNRIYMLQTYAIINDVSPKVGSIEGGTRLTITGNYFDDLSGIRARVLVGGEECKVESVSDTEIICTTSPKPASRTLYSGGRGMKIEVFPGITDIAAEVNSSMDGVWTFYSNSTHSGSVPGDNLLARAQGYFVPSYDANYRFAIKGDDVVRLFLSNGSDPAHAVQAVTNDRINTYYWTGDYALEGGKEYYFEIRFVEYGVVAYFTFGVKVDKTPYTTQETASAITDRQDITITSDIDLEVQKIYLENWVEQTAVSSVWDVEVQNVSCPVSCVGYFFTLTLFGINTEPLQYDSDASVVETAVNSLGSMFGDTVSVTKSGDIYTLAFTSTRGRLILSGASTDTSVLSITLTETTPGVSGLDTFSLTLGGFVSTPVPFDASVEEVQAAVESLYGIRCPEELGSMLGNNRLSFRDMEMENGPSGTRTGENAFCGIYSTRNPDYVFYDEDSPFRTSTYSQVCFAYIGDIADRIRLYYTYKDENNDDQENTHDFYGVGLTTSDAWVHFCEDVNALVRTENPEGSRHKVYYVRIYAGGDGDTDLYVDNILIANSLTLTNEQIQMNQMNIRQSAVPTIQLESITVAKSGLNYSITFVPLECGHNYPLLGIAFSESSNVLPNDAIYSMSNESSIRVERNGTASPPVTGTFDIHFDDETFGSILGVSPDTSSLDMKNLLESLPGVDTATLSRTGNCYGYSWRVYFNSPGGVYPSITPNGTQLVGRNPVVVATHGNYGGLFMEPIYGDFLRTSHAKPQVQVYINDILSHCIADNDNDTATSCDYEWTDATTPTVTSLSVTTASAGVSVTATGTGFSSTSADNTVIIGGIAGTVTSSSPTSVTFTLGDSPGGTQPFSLSVAGKGLATIDPSYQDFTVGSSFTTVSPSSGSIAGCTTVTIAGVGFSDNTTVSIGSVDCSVSSVTYSSITCITSAHAAATSTVEVVTGGVAATSTNSATFDYSTSGVADITAISPSTLSVVGGEEVTISGTGFTSVEGKVQINSGDAVVTFWNDTTIVFTSPGVAAGLQQYNVVVGNVGCATNSASATSLSYSFSVTNITPVTGSLIGGTTVTITGTGFSDDCEVSFGDVACDDVVATSSTSMTCVTTPASTLHYVTNSGNHATYGIGYAWSPSDITINAGDEIKFAWSVPDQVEGVEIGLYTVASATSLEFDNVGFQVPRSTPGSLTYRFNNPGTYHYFSGCLYSDVACSLYMRGSVTVIAPPSSVVEDLSVKLTDLEDDTVQREAENANTFSFTFADSNTPVVNSLSPNNGTTDTTITIQGSGFTATPTVTLNDYECSVTSSNANSISCQVPVGAEMIIGVPALLNVNIAGIGDARTEITGLLDRTFGLLPLVSSISPSSGSLAGGTKITIQGSGFSDQSTVVIGNNLPCDITQSSYSTLVCTTAAVSSPWTAEVLVTESNFPATCGSTCNFTYSEGMTPVVTNRTDSTETPAPAITMTFTGLGFGTTQNNVHVQVGTEECVVSSLTDVEIICTVGRFPAGDNDITVHVEGKGLSRFNDSSFSTINNVATLDSVTPSSGSVNGGTLVTLTGNGFVSSDLEITINDKPIEVQSANFSQITFMTDPNPENSHKVRLASNGMNFPRLYFAFADADTPKVTSVLPIQGVSGDSITLTGSLLGNETSIVTVTIGGVDCAVTAANHTEVDCTLGERAGGEVPIVVKVDGKGLATVTPTFTYELSVSSINPASGSFGGGQEVVIDGQGFSDDTLVTICGGICAVKAVTATQVTCTTLQLTATGGNEVCDVIVANGNDMATLSSSYTYDTSLTPTIISVAPSSGGTAGGTTVTIDGTGFGLSPTVHIDGSECIISSSSALQITCVTEAHQGSIRTKVSVRVGTDGIATQDNADYYYIDKWSSVFTWGGTSLPTTQDFVVISKGQTVLLDTDTAVLTMLLINGGELIFDDQDVKLSAENILITNGGLLQIGTEAEPFQSKAIIEMYGNLRSPELPIYGAKSLGVRNGSLEMHGRHIPYTWSKLAATAAAGDTQITLQHLVNWRVDDEITIASTGLRHSQEENEKRTISAISPDGFTLTLTQALDFEHLGVTKTYGGDIDVEYRAEVGVLSRNIVVRGTNNHAWNDPIAKCEDGFNTGQFATQTCFQGRFGEEVGSDQFGASIMIHSLDPDTQEAIVHLEYVEVTNAGQAFRLGRYPIHWHLMGNVSGMYVRGCAIHRTFNRAVTIHGTHNLLVERNVVYDVMGGALFLEDGIETGNHLRYNLAIFVRQSTSLLNDDITPAAYWVTNPDNIVEHNHAAGGTHFGFWYRMHEHPDGPSFTPHICQQKVELGVFRNNTVHSQGWFGLWIFQTYFPMEGSSCSSTEPSPARFYSLTTWNCEKGAEWVNVGAIQFIDFVVANNEVSGFDFKLVSGTPWGEERGAMLKNAVIIGHSDSEIIASQSYETEIGVILPFAPGLLMSGIRFFNFNRKGTAFGVTSIQGVCTFKCGGFYYWAEKLEFNAVTRKTLWRWEHEGVIQDLDGTLTGGSPNSTVIPYSGIVDSDNCVVQTGDEFSPGLPSAICQPIVRFHRMALNNVSPSSLDANDIIYSNAFGNTTIQYFKKRLTHKPGWMVLMTSAQDTLMRFKDGEQFTNITYNSQFYDFQEDEFVIMTHKFKQVPDRILFNGVERYTIEDAQPLTSTSNNLDWHFDVNNAELKFIVSGKTDSRKKREIGIKDPRFKQQPVSMNIFRCFYDDCIGPVDPSVVPPARGRPEVFQSWSDDLASCINRTDPDNIIILAGNDDMPQCWVVVDVADITVDSITVYGVLDFAVDTNVSAIHILNLGGRIIAGFSYVEPFTSQLTITLRGDHDTPDRPLPGVNLGSKAIGCFGGCDFHGVGTTVQWTHLNNTANIGDTSIELMVGVEWKVGDEIVIATTGYRAQETEKNVIASISEDKKTIGLQNALQNRHMGKEYIIGDHVFPMRAEVGLLTRNIRIIGESYDNIVSQAFGARVLVGFTTSSDNNDLVGWGRFSNVEFFQTGQEGWTDTFDPRFSLAWLDTGSVTDAAPSYVTECAFHDGFSTAIGTFGANGISVTKNVVHRTIHDGIRITGSNIVLEDNLVTVSLTRGTYHDRYEETNFLDWQANFEVSKATNLRMSGNTAAGCERICFHIDGEACDATDENAYEGNVAHGGLHGVHIFVDDGAGDCSMIRNFIVYKIWDFGVYHQCLSSIVIKNTTIADSTINYFPYIFGPAGLSHNYEDKTSKLQDVLVVGRSDHFDPTLDTMDEVNDKNLLHRRTGTGPSKKAPPNTFGGKTGIMLPMFASGPNSAPFKAYHGNLNYPANHGLLDIQGLTAYNFGLNSDGTRDLLFYTNPVNGDAHHPTHLSGVRLFQVEDDSKVFFDRPSVGKVNPSDCVDMECDAKKKCLIKDLDGSFLGGVGAVISDASFAWDDPNELSRGLGDYRIPKTLLTAVDGTRVPVDDIIVERGIIRNNDSCAYKPAWQAFDCNGPNAYDYAMLVIESLDEDTETRRLSPVALLGDEVIDLNNGPQDHGWCFGYTCQLRISTFFTIVATDVEFKLFFTGVPPRSLRFHLLNVDATQTVRLAIYYPKPERLDVYRAESGLYIASENAYYDPDKDEWLLHPPSQSVDGFIPPFGSSVNGANFMDRTADLLYVFIRGDEPIDIKTSPLVIVGLSFPALSTDEFFGDNIVANLATYLGVPAYKIRVVDVVREDINSRKRRSTPDVLSRTLRQAGETVTYVIEIGDEVANGTGTVTSGNETEVVEMLNAQVDSLVALYQTGELWEVLNTTEGLSLYSVEATMSNDTSDQFLPIVVHKIPTQMQITSSLSDLVEQTTFENPIYVVLLDVNGDPVSTLGGTWMVRVSLDTSGVYADDNAALLGDTTVAFSNGSAVFDDIRITHSGSGYRLMFEITEPSGINVAPNFLPVDVTNRDIVAVISAGLGNYVTHGSDVDLTLTLKYNDGRFLDNIGFKGHVWRATVELDDSDLYENSPEVSSSTFTFDPSTGSFTSTGLTVSNTVDYNRYNLVFNVYTEPPLYGFNVYANNIQFIPVGGSLHVENRNPEQITVETVGQSYSRMKRAASTTVASFETYVYNKLTNWIPFEIYLGPITVSDLQNGNSEISFTVYGANATIVEAAVAQLTHIFTGATGLTFNGQQISAIDQTCPIKVNGFCRYDPNTVTLSPNNDDTNYWYIVGPVIGVSVLIAAVLIAISCALKRAHKGKVGDSNQSLQSSQQVGSLGSAFTKSSTPQSGMAPIQM